MGPPEARAFADAFARLVERRAQPDDVEAAFAAILAGAWNDVQIGAYVASLRLLGDDPEVLVAAARALRAQMTRFSPRLTNSICRMRVDLRRGVTTTPANCVSSESSCEAVLMTRCGWSGCRCCSTSWMVSRASGRTVSSESTKNR